MVYVDHMNAPYRGMKMSHLIADTSEELLEMADKIGLKRKWLQNAGTWQEHFDVCQAKRAKAIELGAKSVTRMELGRILAKRPNSPFSNTSK